jgi:hypothetical protein
LTELKEFIERYTRLSHNDWEMIGQGFEKKEFKKNDMILEQGSVCRHFYFLESGLIRFCCIIDGTDITRTFTIPPIVLLPG